MRILTQEIVLDLKIITPFITAILGIIGTLGVQLILRKNDTNKEYTKNINMFKSRANSLLRKFDFFLQIKNSGNKIEIEKNITIRNFKDVFTKFKFDEQISKLSESEEFFINKTNFDYIKSINDLLIRINVFIYQISEVKDLSQHEFNHNVYLFNEITKLTEEIKNVVSKIK